MKTEFDAIVVGCGPNGMTLANYLAKAGLEVAVIERKLEIGGGLTTEEPIVPGVWHNLHHTFHGQMDKAPHIRDLNIPAFNTRFETPSVQAGLALGDGRALTIHTESKRTLASIARLSEKDAKTWEQTAEKYRAAVEETLTKTAYSRPSQLEQIQRGLRGTAVGQELLRWSKMSPQEVVDELFEQENVKALVVNQLPMPRGVLPEYKGLGLSALAVITGADPYQYCVGGSHVLAQSIWRAMMVNECTILSMQHVDKIVVENGVARGVVLADGKRLTARKFVASAVDLKQTFLSLVGKEHLDASFAKQVDEFGLDEFALLGVHIVTRTMPQYKAAAFDASLNEAFTLNIGTDTPAAIDKVFAQIRAGEVPSGSPMYISTPTIYDRSTAPEGIHTVLIWQLVPFELKGGGHEAWNQKKFEVMDQLLVQWREFAPNINEGNMIGAIPFSPWDIHRKLISLPRGALYQGGVGPDRTDIGKVFPELSDYHTPINNLYFCHGSAYPAGGPIGAQAYNAINVIAEEQGIRKWWKNGA